MDNQSKIINTQMDCDVGLSCQSHSTSSPDPILDGIADFDSLRENVTGKLNLEHWMILPSQRTLHIFSLNKKSNGNLSIRSTIFINVDLIVKVFGEKDDDMLFSSRLHSWTQLQTLIEQSGARVKHEVDLESVGVVNEPAKSEASCCEIELQQNEILEIEFCGVKTMPEVEDSSFHGPVTDLMESSMVESESFGCRQNSLLESSLIRRIPLNDSVVDRTADKSHEIHIRKSQIGPVCSKTYVGMDRHMDQHFTGEFFCDICETHPPFETKTRIEDHMKNKHCETSKEAMKCSTCGKEFSTRSQFTSHVSGHDRTKWKVCPICNKSYRCLNRHMRQIHFNIKNYVCDICGSAYKQWTSLKEHIEIRHSQRQEFFCDICKDGNSFRSKAYLKKHFANVHIKARKQRTNSGNNLLPFYECKFCNVKLLSKYLLKKHLATPRNDGKHPIFSCKTCEKTFALKSSLDAHERTHFWRSRHGSGQRKKNIRKPFYECNYCNVKLPSGYSFKKHISLPHNDGKHPMFPCKTCDKIFTMKSSLDAHERTYVCHPDKSPKIKKHKDVKNEKCTMCPREYARSFDLANHMKKVHDVEVDDVV